MDNYLQYQIVVSDETQKEIYLAILADFGFDGFEELETGLNASALEGQVNESEVEFWLKDTGVEFTKNILPAQNWNAFWESNFEPVVVEDFAGVRAHFHAPNPTVTYDLLITPKMSFGTGHHATTWQMIKMMKQLPISGKRIFDFGTGTGVLAILAEKMGAREVYAIDNDDWSITNATENIMANNCKKVTLNLAESPKEGPAYDIILANINKHVILAHLHKLYILIEPGGYLLLSGLLMDDEPDIHIATEPLGFTKVNGSELKGWITLLYKKKG